MFDNVMEKSFRPETVELDDSEPETEPTPIKKPAPVKRALGPKPTTAKTAKRKVVSSDSESSPVKKVESLIPFVTAFY
jgi:hypothetical protein